MRIGRVTGTVTATIKDRAYEGRRLMVVTILAPDGSETGAETLAVDTVGAGVGERVLVLKEGNSAKAILGEWVALQEMIVAVVDRVDQADGGAGSRTARRSSTRAGSKE